MHAMFNSGLSVSNKDYNNKLMNTRNPKQF